MNLINETNENHELYYILYNSINGMILGLSENVHYNFGISNRFSYG